MTPSKLRLPEAKCEDLDWWHACQARIKALEADVQAWEYLMPPTSTSILTGPGQLLRSVPVIIKDIIDTGEMQTSWWAGGYLVSPGAVMLVAVVRS
ncbi:hypothetical protein KG088_08665 [Halomonas sp. TRM85114]|uniref:hypothetical protein n=1 Tax=Halomonas jincaotanensis TaxID=2810616 RepID=UPI001BD59E93|nr:hypothetical protein [Halomonas jincaotanensis]MBS9403700.1 hypothetical protein [Halomonas jincaotanensis]